jgi:hypothetical protein
MAKDARCVREIQFRVVTAKATLNMAAIFNYKLDSNLRKELVTCYMWNIVLCGAEN